MTDKPANEQSVVKRMAAAMRSKSGTLADGKDTPGFWEEIARAGLLSIRQPTDAMQAAALAASPMQLHWHPRTVWQAMIDAGVKKPESDE